MKCGVIAWSVLAAFTAGSAHAATYFDTITPSSLSYSLTDGYNDGAAFLAQSFYGGTTPNFNSVTLALSAQIPSDGNSFMVYLVPDNGTSGQTGMPGSPQDTISGNNVTGFANAQLLGTVSDSVLPAYDSATQATQQISFSVTAAQLAVVSSNSHNGEYWIGIQLSTSQNPTVVSSSVEWSAYSGPGVGTSNQAFWNTSAAPGGQPFSSSGNYQLIVSSSPAPEPTSLALLGIGLVGIGAERYRRRKRRA